MAKIEPTALNELTRNNEKPQLIDVREYSEFAAQCIDGSEHVPLSELEKNVEKIDKTRCVYLICRTGNRASQAAKRLENIGIKNTVILAGGLEAWRQRGLPVKEGASKIWAMERQVRFAAGFLVILGFLLSWLIHPLFIVLSLFVASGLIYSAATDTCGMAMLLSRMPWNKKKASRS